MTKRTWKVQVFAYFPSISDQKSQKYQTQGFHGILEFLDCSQNICKILKNLRICKGAPSPPKKLNFQDFQTISGRSWKLLHSNPQNDVIFGRFQRQRFFFINRHSKSRRQRVRMKGSCSKFPKIQGSLTFMGDQGHIYKPPPK